MTFFHHGSYSDSLLLLKLKDKLRIKRTKGVFIICFAILRPIGNMIVNFDAGVKVFKTVIAIDVLSHAADR